MSVCIAECASNVHGTVSATVLRLKGIMVRVFVMGGCRQRWASDYTYWRKMDEGTRVRFAIAVRRFSRCAFG